MKKYSSQDIINALKIIDSLIARCEKAQLKFETKTPQFSLLKNRIQALKISKYLLENNKAINAYSDTDIQNSLPPIESIIHKTETARKKFEQHSPMYKRLTPTIDAMYLSKDHIKHKISKSDKHQ